MRTTAILPIKKHSERIPGKNFKPLLDRPLWTWIINALLACNHVNEIIIDTDCPEIFSKDELESTDIPISLRDRPAELRGDFVSMDRIIEAIIAVRPTTDIFIQVHATNPFLEPTTIDRATQTVSDGKLDSVFSVTKHHSRFFTHRPQELRNWINSDPGNLIRTQDLPPVYEENSALYVFTPAAFAKCNSRMNPNTGSISISKIEGHDIDSPEDWRIAQGLVAPGAITRPGLHVTASK